VVATKASSLLGALLLLLALIVPDLAFGRVEQAAKAAPADDWYAEDGGACGEDEIGEELYDCGSELDARFGEPLAIALLRSTVVRTTKEQCEELLADIWSRQGCSADGRDCGKLVPGVPFGPAPKLVSSSSSAQSWVAALSCAAATVRRLGLPTDDRLPSLRDLQPPVPPPKLPAH